MKSGLLYLALVGVPILALVGVIRAGERITPPPYVGGLWRVEAPAGSGACAPLPPGRRTQDVTVVQSGTVLELVFDGVRAGARLRGALLRSARLPGTAACPGGWVIEARLEEALGQARLTGRWVPEECGACAPLPFSAARASIPEPAGR